MSLKENIKVNEGFSSKIYEDILGFKTIGYGFLISSLRDDELALNNNMIEPMSRAVAEKILELKLKKLEIEVFKAFSWLKDKPNNIKEVVLEMAYQMGVERVKKFVTTLHHIRHDELEQAFKSGLNSTWAKQTPKRARKVLNGLFSK